MLELDDTVMPPHGARRSLASALRWGLAALLAACAFAPAAQTVYESKDKGGTVFSDKPSPGASAVELGTPNVIAAPPVAQAPGAQAPAAAPYRRFVIDVPTAQGTVHSNTGAFEVRARLSPALRSSDRIVVALDGTALPTRFRSPNLHVSDADWRTAANGADTLHTVQLAVIDARGTVLIETQPVAFNVLRATVSNRRGGR